MDIITVEQAEEIIQSQLRDFGIEEIPYDQHWEEYWQKICLPTVIYHHSTDQR